MVLTPFVAQDYSARERASSVGLTTRQREKALVIVGVTAETDEARQTVHFCSSLIIPKRVLFNGKGEPISDHVPVTVAEMPQLRSDCLVAMELMVSLEDALSFEAIEKMTVVKLSKKMRQSQVYGWQNGSYEILRRFGYRSFEKIILRTWNCCCVTTDSPGWGYKNLLTANEHCRPHPFWVGFFTSS